jgi:hypothetical protein
VEGNLKVRVVRKLLPWDCLPLSSLVFQRIKEFGTKTKELRIQCCGKKVPSYPNFNFDVGCPKKDKLSSPFEVVGL